MKKGILLLIIAVIIFVLSGCQEKNEQRTQTIYGSGFELESCEQITEEDIYELCLRIRDKDPEEFEAIMLTNKFHQHIGPNNIYGAKMALYAKKLLEGENHQIFVSSEAGYMPPISCLNDGIMVAIGATYGRDLIHNIPNQNKLAATFFYKDKSVRLEVKPEKLKETREYIANALKEYGSMNDEYFKDVRKMGLHVWENFPQDNLFIVSYPEEGDICEFNAFNLNLYYNRLHNFLHTGPEKEEVIKFIEEDKCVSDGTMDIVGYSLQISAVWNSTDETVYYYH